MKKFTFILTSMLFLLVGGVFSQTVNLPIKGGYNWNATDGTNSWTNESDVSYTTGTLTLKDNPWGENNNITKSALGGTHWATTFNTGETHTFTVTLDAESAKDLDLHIVAVDATNNDKLGGSFSAVATNNINTTSSKTLTLEVTNDYAAVYLYSTSDGSKVKTYKITSITRTVTSGGGGGGSALDGKTAVVYGIPTVVNTAKVEYDFENGQGINAWGNENNERGISGDDHFKGTHSFWVKNSNLKENDYECQMAFDCNSSEFTEGTKALLHFAIKGSPDKGYETYKMKASFQQSSGSYPDLGVFSTEIPITNKWEEHNFPTTVTSGGNCNRVYFNFGKYLGTFYIDDIVLYKVEEAATGGDNHFTTDDQVANIASSAFSSLAEGDYICADVTGTPEPIKLVCNGSDYPLTQFNGGTLWGIKATDEMVTALKANDSQFKGHDLTLNGIDIYKTVALGEGDNSTALASKINNVFVELTRNFTGGTWNTVCLPFVPSAEQATELFGSGYKLAEFTASGTDKMTFTTIDLENKNFVAGKPYLVYPTANLSHSNKVLANVSITETEGSEDKDNGYKFKGSFEPTTFSENLNLYRFIASGNELKTPTGGTLKSLRCYFEYPSGGNARSFTIDEEGGTTGINAVNGEGFMVNGYYNLNGQRVAKPTKGLYIVNGKKVVIK